MEEEGYRVIEGYIGEYIRQQVGNGALQLLPSSNFVEEGLLDSFAILSLIMELEGRFGISFQAQELADPAIKTISGLAAVVFRKTGASLQMTGRDVGAGPPFGIANMEHWDFFKGKRVVVTGAGTGYGRALSVALLAAGAEVFLLGRRAQRLAESVALATASQELKVKGHCISCDITDMGQIEIAVKKIASTTDTIDILLNCAAIGAGNNAHLWGSGTERWDEMMNVNLKGQWLVSQKVFPMMHRAPVARILFFSSGAGWANTEGLALYNISKAALNSLSTSMAIEYQSRFPDQKISINCINPGEARTEMNRTSQESPDTICRMVFTIISTTQNIPNGRFFHRDGGSLRFCDIRAYGHELK